MFQELSRYLGCTTSECEQRFASYDISKEWEARSSVVGFYQKADFYLYDLTMFEHSEMKRDYKKELIRFAKTANIQSGLDYGCGIGTELLALQEAGVAAVVGVDVEGPPTEYLRWRMQQRGIAWRFIAIDTNTTLPQEPLPKVDLAVCVAVLEHVEKPREALLQIIGCARYVALRIDASENDPVPMHLSKAGNTQWLAQLDNSNSALLQEFGLVRVNHTSPPIYSTPLGREGTSAAS